ncbi:MAG: hypothetical protein JWM95_1088 [Gemmatimonadetes bacterium]|nr:hypothetical protein [Gemmatimonadota bacterium]
MALALPIAPIFLLPFIILFFIVVFPLWVVALAVLGLLLVLARALEWLVRLATAIERPLSGPLGNAFHWTLSWGGMAERRDRPRPDKS